MSDKGTLTMPERFNTQFWTMLDQLVDGSSIVIDRPKNSRHPDWENMVYPLDYGYLAGTTSSDGAGIDLWQGEGGKTDVTAIICAVDLLKKDSEIKLLLGCTEEEMVTIVDFLNTHGMGCYLVRRDR